MTAVAVTFFDVDWILKMVSAPTARPATVSVTPNPSTQTGAPLWTKQTAAPSIPSLAIAATIRRRSASISALMSAEAVSFIADAWALA
jgi:hypothetical protein